MGDRDMKLSEKVIKAATAAAYEIYKASATKVVGSRNSNEQRIENHRAFEEEHLPAMIEAAIEVYEAGKWFLVPDMPLHLLTKHESASDFKSMDDLEDLEDKSLLNFFKSKPFDFEKYIVTDGISVEQARYSFGARDGYYDVFGHWLAHFGDNSDEHLNFDPTHFQLLPQPPKVS